MSDTGAFDLAADFLPESVKKLLSPLRQDIKEKTYEIRIRTDRPVALVGFEGTMYAAGNSRATFIATESLPRISREIISEAFNRLCNYSVYSYAKDISNGFVTLDGGHRVGICATAVTENDKVVSVRDVTSLNIRIAREFKGSADEIIRLIRKNGVGNILIAGPPSSGKTTMLRDLAKQLSDGAAGEMMKVCVVDERREIFSDGGSFSEGLNTDVLLSYPKAAGIQSALRTMSPDYIFTDEIGTSQESEAICEGLNSGVHFALSIHASSEDELKGKAIFKQITNTGRFRYIVLLKGGKHPGKAEKIIDSGGMDFENSGVVNDMDSLYTSRKNV